MRSSMCKFSNTFRYMLYLDVASCIYNRNVVSQQTSIIDELLFSLKTNCKNAIIAIIRLIL